MTLHHKPCNMNLWWSILEVGPSSEYEILFASTTSSLLQEYFDEIVHWHFQSQASKISIFNFSPKSYIVIFPENTYQ